jgi:hypothetical protein
VPVQGIAVSSYERMSEIGVGVRLSALGRRQRHGRFSVRPPWMVLDAVEADYESSFAVDVCARASLLNCDRADLPLRNGRSTYLARMRVVIRPVSAMTISGYR